MENSPDKTISLLEESKLQADVIIPILNALRREIEIERANGIVFEALRSRLRSRYQELAAKTPGGPKEKWAAISASMSIGSDIDIEWIDGKLETFAFNVTRCRYAELFRELGEPELGTVLLCELDNHIAEAAGPEIELTRTQTLMQGASRCEFRYRMK
jgi:hypothetical protein